jgi:hypothetical protein
VAGGGQLEAVVRRIGERVRQLRGVIHQLLGHAAEVDASPAQVAGLGDGDARAVAGGALRAGQPAAAAADHDQIPRLRHVAAGRVREGR